MVFNLSCLLYYLRKRRQEFSGLHASSRSWHRAFIPAVTALGIGSSPKFVTPPASRPARPA